MEDFLGVVRMRIPGVAKQRGPLRDFHSQSLRKVSAFWSWWAVEKQENLHQAAIREYWPAVLSRQRASEALPPTVGLEHFGRPALARFRKR